MNSLNIIVESMFCITPNTNVVLSGSVCSGKVSIGEMVRVHSPKSYVDAKVKGVEVDRKIVRLARQGNNVALLFSELDLDKLSDGLVIQENSTVPIVESIEIRVVPKLWWQIWR